MILAMALAAAVTLPTNCTAIAGRIWECHVDSRVYTLIMPAQRVASAILLLHGAGRNHKTLIDDMTTRQALLASRSIIVMPDGGNSWWLRRGEWIALMDAIEKPLGIKRWSAAGWSMGGYGSLRLVEEFPQRFVAWGGMIGLLDYPNPSYPKEWNHGVPAVFGEAAKWDAENPLRKAGALRGKRVWVGTAEEAFDRKMNEAFDAALRREGIAHVYRTIPGAHKFDVVTALLPELIEFLDMDVK